MTQSTPAGVVVGLDIGGSKTRGITWRDGVLVADAVAGSANVQNVPKEVAEANLAELFAALAAAAPGAAPRAVYAGAGGIDTDEDAAALAALIAPHAPGAQITVVHDTRLLLAAGGARTGVSVIAGTGSAAWGTNDDGASARAGGWGYLLGDEGSGYWLGREAVRHSLKRMDLGLEPDTLTAALLAHVGLDDPRALIAHFHHGTTRRYWAAVSPVVFDAAAAGHAESLAMIETAARDLVELAAQCAHQLGITGPIVLGSGLGSNQPALQQSFRTHAAAAGLGEVRILDKDPIFGVLELVDR
ncbi:N-acetylglucosamine kinase [Arthrobacter sp. 35W]|uniref:N-acetylglucosamine kinase n=1 Tax=Arthrobacter sp. 35W TaxID=1132441 RepID=UPI000424D457|nr:BadF/BadG/BcrA/BcrD ATPase family protein [Arthrobacter sp. 35W]